MATIVIKRDGAEEPFNENKIRNSIAAAAKEAGISEDRQKKIVNQASKTAIEFFANEDEVTTDEIREKILSELDAIEPKVSEAWRNYEIEQEKFSAT